MLTLLRNFLIAGLFILVSCAYAQCPDQMEGVSFIEAEDIEAGLTGDPEQLGYWRLYVWIMTFFGGVDFGAAHNEMDIAEVSF